MQRGLSAAELVEWFSVSFVDGYDWVMLANVFGMSQWADGYQPVRGRRCRLADAEAVVEQERQRGALTHRCRCLQTQLDGA